MARVLVVGDVMQDIVVKPDGSMRRGTDVAAAIRALPGGSAANQAAWLAEQGLDVVLCGRVGAEDRDALAAAYRIEGVRAVLAGDEKLQTGRLVSLVEPDGERSFFTDRGANKALVDADVPDTEIARADLLVLSGYTFCAPETRRMAVGLIARARQSGVPVAVDPASSGFIADVGAGAFLDLVQGATILLPNAEEAAVLAGTSTPETQLKTLCHRFETVVIKRGSDGAMGATAGSEIATAPAPTSEVVDTTGAGDAFASGFLAGWLRGCALDASIISGNEAGARAVARLGGRP